MLLLQDFDKYYYSLMKFLEIYNLTFKLIFVFDNQDMNLIKIAF